MKDDRLVKIAGDESSIGKRNIGRDGRDAIKR